MGSPTDTPEQLANTEGHPVTGCEVRVVRRDGDEAAIGEEGEVWLRGPMVCRGYTDPVLTEECFAVVDSAGAWLRTGDLGYVRADEHVVLTGRLKDIIIRKGENISAKEIEDLLYQDPRVGAVAVIGLPDPVRGERVCAVVERRPGVQPPTLEEIAERLRSAGLMAQKIPEQLEVVDALPLNETLRKVLKHQLRDLFSALPWQDPQS